MRRFGRWLFNGVAAISLLICVASAAMFVRSEFVSECLMKRRYDRALHQFETTALGWINGRLVFDRDITIYPPPYDSDNAVWPPDSTTYQRIPAAVARTSPASNRWLWLSHVRKSISFGRITDETIFYVHSLLIFLAAAVLPVIWTRRFVHRRRASRIGLCPRCGYDLRATPDRCPECGTIPPNKESVSS
jgi:hypothetical protein